MLRVISVALFLLSISANSVTYAADTSAIQLSVAAGNVSQQRKEIESKITQPQYVEMENSDRVILLTQLESIDTAAVSGNTITIYEKNINSILNEAFANSKVVCQSDKPTGSKRALRTCTTVAAKTRQHQQVQQARNTGSGPAASTGVQ